MQILYCCLVMTSETNNNIIIKKWLPVNDSINWLMNKKDLILSDIEYSDDDAN